MDLGKELQQRLLAFVEGRLEEHALFAWLGGAGRHIDREDLQTREVWKTAVSTLSEVAGHPHDVDSVRSDLARLLTMATGQSAPVQDPAASRFIDDVLDQIRRYVDGLIPASALSAWLDTHAQEIHDTADLEIRGLADHTFSLLEEVLQGSRSDESARRSLSNMAPLHRQRGHALPVDVIT
jgi:hypothetical protein